MQLKNMMVAFNGTDSAVEALKLAAKLAITHDAHVTAFLVHANYETINSRASWIPHSARKIIEDANTEIISAIEKRFADVAGDLKLGSRLQFKNVAGRVDAVLSDRARYFDILFTGVHLDSDEEHISLHPDRIALMSGRPVLITPKTGANALSDNMALLWDGSRASARALADAMPFIEDAKKLKLVTLSNKPVDLAAIMDSLSYHGVQAEHQELTAQFAGVRALTAFCEDEEPSLLIMGAYEHSKFREDFLGGLSSELLRNVNLPMLISH